MLCAWLAALGVLAVSVTQGANTEKFKKHAYLLPQMCTHFVREIDFDDQVIVMSQLRDQAFYKTNVSCTLNFKTTSPQLGLTVTFETVDTVDTLDYLKIIPQKSPARLYYGHMIKGNSPLTSLMYVNESLQVEWKVPEHTETQRPGHGFRIALTAYKLDCEEDEMCFFCDNSREIHPRLVCNGYNNCGDNSDEKTCSANKPKPTPKPEPEPQPTPTPSITSLWIITILLFCTALLLAFTAIYLAVLLRKKNEEVQTLLDKGIPPLRTKH